MWLLQLLLLHDAATAIFAVAAIFALLLFLLLLQVTATDDAAACRRFAVQGKLCRFPLPNCVVLMYHAYKP